MIPGELFVEPGDAFAERGPRDAHAQGREHGRSTDPGRFPLPFLRDQRGAPLRPRSGARVSARYPGGHRGAFRARPGAHDRIGGLWRRPHRLRLQRQGHG